MSDAAPDTSRLAVDCRGVHVHYTVHAERPFRLADLMSPRATPSRARTIHAVRGVDLQIQEGELLGIIGPNGSGKSTLLRAMAGLLPPSAGTIDVRTMPTLLGVNAALRPHLSGARNVRIGCLAAGMSAAEADARYDEIVDFADLREFIDLPMTAYSSGMRARLHFAIATAVTPEILFVDEALAVGDAAFRERSLERIQSMRRRSGTVVLVSHNLTEIRKSCSRVVWIERGEIRMDDRPNPVVAGYRAAVKERQEARLAREQGE